MNYNLNSGWGQLEAQIAQRISPTFGKIFIVIPSTDPNYDKVSKLFHPDPEGKVRVYTDIQAALDATTDGQMDIVLVAPGRYAVTSKLTMTKNLVKLIGLGGFPSIANHANSASTSGFSSPVIVSSVADSAIEIGGAGSVDGVEIAHLDIQPKADYLAIDVGGATGENNGIYIHDIAIGLSTSLAETTTYLGISSGNIRGMNHSVIEKIAFYNKAVTAAFSAVASLIRVRGQKNEIRNIISDTAGVAVVNMIDEDATTSGGNKFNKLDLYELNDRDSSVLIRSQSTSSFLSDIKLSSARTRPLRAKNGRAVRVYADGRNQAFTVGFQGESLVTGID